MTREITLTRRIAADAATVFSFWTDPALIARWYAPVDEWLVGDAQTAIRDGAITTRSELTGVNLDNEAVDLLKFQQAYQASSRVIQVAKETFQSILEIR